MTYDFREETISEFDIELSILYILLNIHIKSLSKIISLFFFTTLTNYLPSHILIVWEQSHEYEIISICCWKVDCHEETITPPIA